MISVSEAKDIIANSLSFLPPVELPLMQVFGQVLARDVFAHNDIPPFDQSSVDGYAFRFNDRTVPLRITGEMAAGAANKLFLGEGETVRIFTGAPLPGGADTIVMQEKASVDNGHILIKDDFLEPGSSVRYKGAEVAAGNLALVKGTGLSPAAIGFLAGIGVARVFVYPVPSVAIIVTGKELQAPGTSLSYGQVYESNSYSLTAALERAGVKNVTLYRADDDLQTLRKVLYEALQKNDVVLLTGGVSVGDYDFVVEAAKLCNVEQKFHKVRQRPGKPLYYGLANSKPVFGLPGNPSSVLSCFYNYVLPALESLSCKKSSQKIVAAFLGKNYSKQKGLTHFLKGYYQDGIATPLHAQESFKLSSFAEANCLICLREDRSDYKAGETVDVYLLP